MRHGLGVHFQIGWSQGRLKFGTLWGETKVYEIVNLMAVEGVECHEASPMLGPESGGALVGVAGTMPLR
jgi:hypothetical protein